MHCGCEQDWKGKLYTPRLRTAEAYRIYIEKDPSVRMESVCHSLGTSMRAMPSMPTGWHLRTSVWNWTVMRFPRCLV